MKKKESFLIESYISVGELVNIMYDHELSYKTPSKTLDIYNSSNLSTVVLLRRLELFEDFRAELGETCALEIRVGKESYLAYIYFAGLDRESKVLVWKNSSIVQDNEGINIRHLFLKNTDVDFVAVGICKTLLPLFEIGKMPIDIERYTSFSFVVLDMLSHLLSASNDDLAKTHSLISDLEDLVDFKSRFELSEEVFSKSVLSELPKNNWQEYLIFRLVGGLCKTVALSKFDLDVVYVGILDMLAHQVRVLVTSACPIKFNESFLVLSELMKQIYDTREGIRVKSKLFNGLPLVNLVVSSDIIAYSDMVKMYKEITNVGNCYICKCENGALDVYATVLPKLKVVKVS